MEYLLSSYIYSIPGGGPFQDLLAPLMDSKGGTSLLIAQTEFNQ